MKISHTPLDSRLTPVSQSPEQLHKLAYTSRELSSRLGISPRSLRRLEQRGLIKPSRALRVKIFSAEEVMRFLRESSDIA